MSCDQYVVSFLLSGARTCCSLPVAKQYRADCCCVSMVDTL
jgi:hypothetical protein